MGGCGDKVDSSRELRQHLASVHTIFQNLAVGKYKVDSSRVPTETAPGLCTQYLSEPSGRENKKRFCQ